MNRLLVEHTVHSEELQAIAEESGDRWRAHANQVIGTLRGHQRLAQLNLVDWSKPYAETSFSSVLDQRISTRLGEGDRRVSFARPVEGPFGNPIDELMLRAWWVAYLPSDADTADDVVVAQGRITFRAAGRLFVYDRLGLRPNGPLAVPEQDDGP
jgi:CRISPR-associated endonuclease/helicase Cas3